MVFTLTQAGLFSVLALAVSVAALTVHILTARRGAKKDQVDELRRDLDGMRAALAVCEQERKRYLEENITLMTRLLATTGEMRA